MSPTWRTVRLDEVATLISGSTPKGVLDHLIVGSDSVESVPFFKVGDMNLDPAYLHESRSSLPTAKVREFKMRLIPEGAVVFPKAGGAIATNKKRLVARAGVIDLNCMAAVAGPELDSRFLRLWFEALDLAKLSDGSVLPQLSKRTISELEIPLPELAEQRRVVEVLEDHLSRIRAAEVLTASGWRRASTFASSSATRLLVSASTHGPSMPLGSLVEVLDHQRVPVSRAKRSKRPGQVPYYGATGQVDTIDAALFDEDLVLLGEDGVDFLSASKPKAYTISGPSWVNNHAHVLRPTSTIDYRFLATCLNASDYRGLANGTTRLKLTKSAMMRLRIPLPDLSEQLRLIAQHEAAVMGGVRLRQNCTDVAARSRALRNTLLRAGFAGDLTRGGRLAGRSS